MGVSVVIDTVCDCWCCDCYTRLVREGRGGPCVMLIVV